MAGVEAFGLAGESCWVSHSAVAAGSCLSPESAERFAVDLASLAEIIGGAVAESQSVVTLSVCFVEASEIDFA